MFIVSWVDILACLCTDKILADKPANSEFTIGVKSNVLGVHDLNIKFVPSPKIAHPEAEALDSKRGLLGGDGWCWTAHEASRFTLTYPDSLHPLEAVKVHLEQVSFTLPTESSADIFSPWRESGDMPIFAIKSMIESSRLSIQRRSGRLRMKSTSSWRSGYLPVLPDLPDADPVEQDPERRTHPFLATVVSSLGPL